MSSKNTLGQLESFRISRVSVQFSRKFYWCYLTFPESDKSSLHRIFESEIFRLPLSKKNSLTWGAVMRKIKLYKIPNRYFTENSCWVPLNKSITMSPRCPPVTLKYATESVTYRLMKYPCVEKSNRLSLPSQKSAPCFHQLFRAWDQLP